MTKAIIFKEWVKTREFLLLSFVITIGAVVFNILRLDRIISLKGAAHLWEVMISRDAIFIDMMSYLPLCIALLLAVVQFVPEMLQKRLKLTLHLPYPRNKMIIMMLVYGLCSFLIIAIIQYVIMFGYMAGVFPQEMINRLLLTVLHWNLTAICIYLALAWIILEPTWKRRILYMALSYAIYFVFTINPLPEAYNYFLPIMVLLVLCFISFPLVSVLRFREGQQD